MEIRVGTSGWSYPSWRPGFYPEGTRPEQFHYTLKFLGEQPPARADKAIAAADSIRENVEQFEISLGSIGAFPNTNRPGTIWLGTNSGGDALAEVRAQPTRLHLDEIQGVLPSPVQDERPAQRPHPPLRAWLGAARLRWSR